MPLNESIKPTAPKSNTYDAYDYSTDLALSLPSDLNRLLVSHQKNGYSGCQGLSSIAAARTIALIAVRRSSGLMHISSPLPRAPSKFN